MPAPRAAITPPCGPPSSSSPGRRRSRCATASRCTARRCSAPVVDKLGSVVGGEEVFGFEGGHAAGAGGGDGLTVLLVLAVAGGEDAGDVGLGGARDGEDVALLVAVDL